MTQILDQIIDPPLVTTPPAPVGEMSDAGLRGREMVDPAAAGANHLFFEWDTSMFLDAQLDLFGQSLL